MAAINCQLREDTSLSVGSCSLHSCAYPIPSHQVMLFLKRLNKEGRREDHLFVIGYCSLHSRPCRVLLYLERTSLTKTPHLGRSSCPILRSSLVMVLLPQKHHILSANYPCPQRGSQQVKENAQPTYPQRPKPPPGILVFARLAFLDSKVTGCYGCGNSLKPEGTTPHPPDDLVLTTRLLQQYYKEGRQHT